MYVRPFRVMAYMMPMTLSMVAVSVMPILPSPRRITLSPSLLMMRWMRWLPYISLTRATVPLRMSSSFQGPSVIWSRRCTMNGFMLFPFRVMVTVFPSEIIFLISSIITALSMVIVFVIHAKVRIFLLSLGVYGK